MSDEHILYKVLSELPGYFECQCPILSETAKAICFDGSKSDLNSHAVWIPKSQTKEVFHPDFGRRIFIKNWLYSKFD